MIKNSEGFEINLDFLLENENLEDISIVVAHEKIIDNQRSTLGAVLLTLDDSQKSNGISVFLPLFAISLASTVILFKGRFL